MWTVIDRICKMCDTRYKITCKPSNRVGAETVFTHCPLCGEEIA